MKIICGLIYTSEKETHLKMNAKKELLSSHVWDWTAEVWDVNDNLVSTFTLPRGAFCPQDSYIEFESDDGLQKWRIPLAGKNLLGLTPVLYSKGWHQSRFCGVMEQLLRFTWTIDCI